MKIVLLSCGSAKQNRKAKAKDLYTGNLFKASLRYAEGLQPDKIFILSAKHHILELDDEIDPYDSTLSYIAPSKRKPELKVLTTAEKIDWGKKVIEQLSTKADIKKDEFIILAGREYTENILSEIKNYELPLDGLKQGERLKFFNGNQNNDNNT